MEKNQWNIIPSQCLYQNKVYRILDIDLQGGYFTLQDPEAKERGDLMVIDNIDMDECYPIN